MKKKITLFALLALVINFKSKAQIISDFEDANLPLGTYWNGSDLSGGFVNGGMYFPNLFDTAFGGLWLGGFAYSSVSDSVTSGAANLYAAKTATGFNNSSTYAIVQQNAITRLNNVLPTMVINGFYVTNGTYAYNSIRDGDAFARKFGDTTGTNSGLPQGSYPDYFKLTVKAFVAGQLSLDSVEFYLADYRFTNDSLDYAVNTWEWVDCSILGVFDSLKFTLSSSDNGAFGMNTPGFFCIDNLTIDVTVGTNEIASGQVTVYPNPANAFLNFTNLEDEGRNQLSVFNVSGQKVMEQSNVNAKQKVSIEHLSNGIYTIQIQTQKGLFTQKFVKQ